MLGVEPVTRRNARLQAARSRRSSKRRVLTSCAAWTPGPTSATRSSRLPQARASPKSTRTRR